MRAVLATMVLVLMALAGSVGCSWLLDRTTSGQNDSAESDQSVDAEPTVAAPTSTLAAPGQTMGIPLPTAASRVAATPAASRSSSQPGAAGIPGTSGIVKSVSGSTFQVTTADGKAVAVKTDSSTAFVKISSAALSDLKAGTLVMIVSDKIGTTVTARSIQIESGLDQARGNSPGRGAPPGGAPPKQGAAPQGGTPPSQGARPQGGTPSQGSGPQGGMPASPASGQSGAAGQPGMSGTIKSVSGKTLAVTAQDGTTVTVQVDDKTTYQKAAAGTRADVKAGESVVVSGETSGGTLTARMVQIGGTAP